MNFLTWQSRLTSLKVNTLFLLLTNFGLGMMVIFSWFYQLTQKPIVIVQPMVAQEPLEIRASTLTKSYAVSFALSFALLIGNVNSNNVAFILNSIANYISPDYFATFRKQLVADMKKLNDKRMDMSFTAADSFYDPQTDQVVIDGTAVYTDPTGATLVLRHQYRFRLILTNYLPRITEIQSLEIRDDRLAPTS